MALEVHARDAPEGAPLDRRDGGDRGDVRAGGPDAEDLAGRGGHVPLDRDDRAGPRDAGESGQESGYGRADGGAGGVAEGAGLEPIPVRDLALDLVVRAGADGRHDLRDLLRVGEEVAGGFEGVVDGCLDG